MACTREADGRARLAGLHDHLPTTRPLCETTRSRRALALFVLCSAQFMVVLDSSAVSVALPSMRQAFDASDQHAQWIVIAYELAFGGLLLLGGRASDIYDRRTVFVLGALAFAAFSLCGGLAPSLVFLILARLGQGAGAAFLVPAALSLITTTFQEGEHRDRALSIYGSIIAAGFATGGIAGGVLTTALSWRWVMAINLPVGLIAVFLAPRVLQTSRHDKSRRLDLVGALLITATSLMLAYGVTLAAGGAWQSPKTIGVLLAALGLAALATLAERRTEYPLLPRSVLRSRRLRVSCVVGAMTVGAASGVVVLLALYMQDVLGYTAVQAGLVFAVFGAAAVGGGFAVAPLVRLCGPVRVLSLGLIVQCCATVSFLLLQVDGPVGVLLGGCAAFGLGNVAAAVAYTILGTGGIESRDQGVLGGLLNTAQQLGGGLGVALLVSVATAHATTLADGHDSVRASSPEAMLSGYRFALVGAAGLALCGALVSLLGNRALEPHRRATAIVTTQAPTSLNDATVETG